MKKKDKEKKEDSYWMPIGMSLGMCIGIALDETEKKKK